MDRLGQLPASGRERCSAPFERFATYVQKTLGSQGKRDAASAVENRHRHAARPPSESTAYSRANSTIWVSSSRIASGSWPSAAIRAMLDSISRSFA